MGVEFLKGHGTENDFIVLPDPDGELDLTIARVRALCDRQRGLGADGVLRVVPARFVPDAPSEVDGDTWFMDYRNADGSIAEMCGNGTRVFAKYLADAGLVTGENVVIGTRAGNRPATLNRDGTVTVWMGKATVGGRSTVTAVGKNFDGVAVDVGNPHVVCVADSDLSQYDLTVPPSYDPDFFPHGVNVEFVTQINDNTVQMRVYERGVGETRACGTGAIAVALATLHLRHQDRGELTVAMPGGVVTVAITESGSTMTGPAVFVARGELDETWWIDARKE